MKHRCLLQIKRKLEILFYWYKYEVCDWLDAKFSVIRLETEKKSVSSTLRMNLEYPVHFVATP